MPSSIPRDPPEDLAGFQVEDRSPARCRRFVGVALARSEAGVELAGRRPASRPSGLKATAWNRLVGSSWRKHERPSGTRPGLEPAVLGGRGDDPAVGPDRDPVDRADLASWMPIDDDTTPGLLATCRGWSRRGRTRPASSSVFPATRSRRPSGKKATRAIGPPSPRQVDRLGVGRGVPELDRLVRAGRRQPAAVGAEGHAGDVLGVAAEREGLLARRRFPRP